MYNTFRVCTSCGTDSYQRAADVFIELGLKIGVKCVFYIEQSLERLLTKSFGFEEPLTAFGGSSKSCSLDIDAVLGFWFEIFQIHLLLCAIYSNI